MELKGSIIGIVSNDYIEDELKGTVKDIVVKKVVML